MESGSVARDTVSSAQAKARAQSRPVRPRQVRFELGETPLHWIPGDPFVSHLLNVTHLLLPSGERWFVRAFQEALPLVTDERLRAEIRGFMGQEATHARAHAAALEHIRTLGIDPDGYTRALERFISGWLGERPPIPLPRREWLLQRLAIIAAVEHFTYVLGAWVLGADALDRANPDPATLDLLRWHGAEEVEHRSVAFDALVHLAGPAQYRLRAFGMLLAVPALIFMWDRAVRYLVRGDRTLHGQRFGYRDFWRAVRQGLAPGKVLLAAIPRYLRPRHHPSKGPAYAQAIEYLASSRTAREIDG